MCGGGNTGEYNLTFARRNQGRKFKPYNEKEGKDGGKEKQLCGNIPLEKNLKMSGFKMKNDPSIIQ